MRALELGSEAPSGDFGFTVHSVFESAVNLAPSGGGALVTLVGEEKDCPPRGLRLAFRGRFDSWGIRAGAEGRRAGDRLSFGAEEAPAVLSIDLSRARRLDPGPLPRIDPLRAGLAEAWAECAAVLEGIQEKKGTELRLAELRGHAAPGSLSGSAMGARLAWSALTLASALLGGAEGLRRGARGAAWAPGPARAAAARLVGLGSGLTPSGDDFLCGLIAAFECSEPQGWIGGRFLEELRAGLPSLAASTNAISATYLFCAVAGAFAASVLRLARVLAAGGDSLGPRAAVEALCGLGHASGADAATGLLFGIRIRMDAERRQYAP